MNTQKIKVSKEQFALVLYHWLSKDLTEEAIIEKASAWNFTIQNDDDVNKIFNDLFILSMWIIVHACERAFDDEDKRNECLDVFHYLVYKKIIEGTEEDFSKWIKSIGAKYIEYQRAMETNHPSGPLWVVAKHVNKNLFGEIKEDFWVQMEIGEYIGLNIKHLEGLIKKYKIE